MEQLTQFLFNTDHSAPGIGELMIFVAIILIVPSLTQALYARRCAKRRNKRDWHILFRFLLFFSSFSIPPKKQQEPAVQRPQAPAVFVYFFSASGLGAS